MDFAIGELRLTPIEFGELTLSEYFRKAYGYHRQEELKWTHTRYIASLIINANRSQNSSAVRPEDIIHLKTVDKVLKKDWTQEEVENIFDSWGIEKKWKKD